VQPASILIFLLAASIAWGINIFAKAIFPSLHWLPYLIRSTMTLAVDLLLLFVSIRLFEKYRIPAEALGLPSF